MLRPVAVLIAYKRPRYDAVQVVALIAYERPHLSPLAWLLGPGQRERVADAANAALLAAVRGQPPGSICAVSMEIVCVEEDACGGGSRRREMRHSWLENSCMMIPCRECCRAAWNARPLLCVYIIDQLP